MAFDSTRDENYRNSHQWTGTLHSGANGWAIDVIVSNSAQSFALTNVWSGFSALSPAIPHLQVQTGSATSFLELSPANLTAITAGVTARVKGPLFHTTAGTGEPTMAALQVSGKP